MTAHCSRSWSRNELKDSTKIRTCRSALSPLTGCLSSDSRLNIVWEAPTWNSGTVERMSMMMEASRKRELTITNTFGVGEAESSINHSDQPHYIVVVANEKWFTNFYPFQFLTLAAFDELGSSKSFQMTFLRFAQHIPSNGCGCNKKLFGRRIINSRLVLTFGPAFANKAQIFITTILLFWEGFFVFFGWRKFHKFRHSLICCLARWGQFELKIGFGRALKTPILQWT